MTQKSRTYEGMFLVDTGKSDFEAAAEPIRKILERSQAEILSIKPWDEKRLAYDIRGRRRALYVLTYFKIDPASASDIERYCELSEEILRVLILRRDGLTDDQINANTPAEAAAAKRAKPPRPDAAPRDGAKDDSPDKKAEPEKPQPQDEPAPAAADQPADTKPADTKPADTKPADTKPADQTSKEPQT